MKLLIGSNGGLVGIYLAKQYKKMRGITVFGADSTEIGAGRFFVNKQFNLPPATDSNFIERLISLLNENSIDVYLPTHSMETKIVSQQADLIRNNTKAKFIVSPSETFADLEDKSIANKKMKRAGLPVPAVVRDLDCKYPVIMKNNIGSGSRGTIKIENREIHEAYRNTCGDVSFYEILQGKEYTLDCLFDCNGKMVGYNQRQRVKTIGGAVSITSNASEFDIQFWLDILTKRWKFCGCVNFQYIVQAGIPYFIDINLRYPSGGLPLSVASGFDIPKLILDILLERPFEKFVMPKENRELTMYRYFEEIFEK